MIWLDMDPGVDDALALLYLLAGDRRPVIAGISVTGGNVDVSQCARNAARICYWAKWEGLIEQIPTIACGTDLANVREGASNVHGEDGMGDWNGWEEIDKEIGMGSGHKAVDVLNRALSNDPGIITIVATGPCSNLAQLIEKHPSSLAKAKEIIIMGGAFFDAGNRGPRSEFNIHSDSAAAREVLRYCRGEHPEMLGIITPLTFVGLDVTHRVMLERKVLGKMNAPIAKLAAAISGKYMNFYRDQALGIDGCPLHDPLAVAIALRPELVVREPYHVEIVSTPDVPDTDGITVADYRPCERFKKHELAVTQVCVAVDSRAFLDDFYHRINRPSKRTSV
jgi:purine nucleosidase